MERSGSDLLSGAWEDGCFFGGVVGSWTALTATPSGDWDLRPLLPSGEGGCAQTLLVLIGSVAPSEQTAHMLLTAFAHKPRGGPRPPRHSDIAVDLLDRYGGVPGARELAAPVGRRTPSVDRNP